MVDHSKHIGELILSSNFGYGTIIGIEEMGTGRDFFVVDCSGNNVKSFVPVDDEDSYRFLSEKADIEIALGTLEKLPDGLDFESKKERINYFKDQSKVQDTGIIAKLISQMGHIEDRGSTEDQVMNKLVESFALEYSLITNKSPDECKKLVLDKIKGAKNE